MGKLLGIIHQLCQAHGLHLAVCNILYKNTKFTQNQEESEDEADGDLDEEDGDRLGEGNITEPELIIDADVIEKVRKIVRKFRRSTLNNDGLQDKISEVLGKEKQLVIDVK